MTHLSFRDALLPDLALRAGVRTLSSLRLLELDVVNATMERTLDWICDRIRAGAPTRIAFLNAHCANVAARDAAYRRAIGTATALLPDGAGLAIAARMHGQRLTANLNGTDLVPALCGRLAQEGGSVFLLGAAPGVAEDAAAALQTRYPGLRVAGVAHGFFPASEEREVIRTINASGADLLLTAMGVPAQDVFLERHAHELQPPVVIGVGALFDFLAGRVSRAPAWLRKAGLEWTWRLAQEPARLARRYILGNPAFLARAAISAMAPVLAKTDAAAKRAIDVAAAGAGLVVLAAPLLLLMAAIRLTTQGPAILRQTRIGQDGKPFTLLKLRTMYQDAEARRTALLATNQHGAGGITFKLRRDPRVTPLGRLLRRSSIDELPQLWNVLTGDMSLVGPRPQLPHEVARYTPHQSRRLDAKPGLTCLWQVSGRADLPFERQVELDLEYVATRSVLQDIRILLRTVPAVFTARGAY